VKVRQSLIYGAALAIAVAGGASCADEPSVTTGDAAYTTDIPTRFPAAARVVALGDVHGDIEAMRTALWVGDLIDEDDQWIGGETVVVQTGDLLDRGDDEQAIIDLMKDLQGQAKEAGGALHLLNGNHELMNVALDFSYVTNAGFADFEDAPGVDADDPWVADFEPHMRARASAFMPGGAYAKKIAHHPVVVIVGDTAFAHGGVLPSYAADIKRINGEVAEWLLGMDDLGMKIVDDGDSPVWSRHYSDDPSRSDCRKLDDALEIMGVTRMVVGHTVQDHITSGCDDKVWRVDVGMAAAYGGTPEVLELTDGGVFTIALGD
jgi:hypothetical protein